MIFKNNDKKEERKEGGKVKQHGVGMGEVIWSKKILLCSTKVKNYFCSITFPFKAETYNYEFQYYPNNSFTNRT